jgi:hypothetical protein
MSAFRMSLEERREEYKVVGLIGYIPLQFSRFIDILLKLYSRK